MIAQTDVAEKILDYLNHRISLETLVDWAGNALFTLSESDVEQPNEATLIAILGYIGASDTSGFPLTWEVLSKFLNQLNTQVQVTYVNR